MSPAPNEPIRVPKTPPTPKPVQSVLSLMRLDQEKRQHYRVQQAAMPTLHAIIPFDDGTQRVGRCQDVSVGGTGVRFTNDQDPRLVAGQEIVLLFSTPKYDGTLQVAAKVLNKKVIDVTSVRYTFAFTRPDELKEHAVGSWGRWFNRRRYRRMAPDTTTTVPAVIRWPKGQIEGKVIDVSMGGLGISIPLGRTSELDTVKHVYLSVVLAENIGEVRFAAIVRSRTKGMQTSRIGFELEHDAGFEKTGPILQRWIEKSVMRRAASIPPQPPPR
jgi:c-di-GMP-binding flagellar brake protein YcgR